MKNYSDQMDRVVTSIGHFFFIADKCRRVQLAVGRALSRQVILGFIRKAPEQKKGGSQ